jgi:phosphatidylserine/phosphatidylglycerophosphate/cardiolipin synthase-like enzyme
LTQQVDMIDKTNEQARLERTMPKPFFGDAVDRRASAPRPLPEVVAAANRIDKPSALILEDKFGLRVCVAVLNACEFNQARRAWRYREIYIHSKLLLVDDSFFTLGSANLNQRSMAVDSEINLATNDQRHATALRKRIWSTLATEENNGGNATPKEIEKTFSDWVKLMKVNKDRQKARSNKPVDKQMEGFIVPLDDGRCSIVRVA